MGARQTTRSSVEFVLGQPNCFRFWPKQKVHPIICHYCHHHHHRGHHHRHCRQTTSVTDAFSFPFSVDQLSSLAFEDISPNYGLPHNNRGTRCLLTAFSLLSHCLPHAFYLPSP